MNRHLVDGFLLSASMCYLPNVYRASALAQMEVLRWAKGYRTRWYLIPEDLEDPIPARSQVEHQVRVEIGSYLWGVSFSAPFAEVDNVSLSMFLQVTDACTETPLLSDYARGIMFEPVSPRAARRNPVLITPRLIGEPGTLDVEIYNGNAVDVNCQIALLVAEPCVAPGDMVDELVRAGVAEVMG